MSNNNADISAGYGNKIRGLVAVLQEAGVGAFFRRADAERAGLTRDNIQALVGAGAVEPLGPGFYRRVEIEPTENYTLAMVAARVPESIFCLLTALQIHEIGTQAPADVWLGVPHKARRPTVAHVRLRIVRFSGKAWSFGIAEIEFEGVRARVTSPARTIVDCFRFERLIGPEVSLESLKDGLRRKLVTVAELSRIEEELPARRLRALLDARSI